MKIKYTLLFILILPLVAIAQDYSNEDYIFLKRHQYIKVDLKNNKIDIAKKVIEQAEFLTANKLYFANEIIGYDSFTDIKDINAYTYIPKSDTTVEVDYIETQRVFDNGIFYSDQEYKNFTFPAVTKGAITNLSYTEIVKDPHFLGLYTFGTYVPTKSGQLVVEFPKNVEIGYISFNTEETNIDFKQETEGDYNIYTWTTQNLNGFQGEENSEENLHIVPHIIVYIKNYTVDGKKYPVLNNAKDLYNWYVSLTDQIDTSNMADVHKIAADITKSLPSKEEKAKAIFNWVQDNITYVAFEDGLGGFVPRGAASVCSKRYGDCKDMANLLYEMLNHVGIESYRAWIGTRNRPYSYYDVPTPMVDNHMITAAIIANDTLFLDATDSYVPFGMPSAFTQTKEALIGIDKDTYNIVKVPIQAPEKSLTTVNSAISLVDGKILVNEEREMTGYNKVDFVFDYTFKKGDKTKEEYLNNKLQLGNNKTKYLNIQTHNFDNTGEPLLISYDLEIANYAKTVGSKTFVNLNIDKTLSKSKIDIEDRKYSKKIDNTYKHNYTTTLELPKGYTIAHLPDEISYNDPRFGFKINYTKENNSVVQHKEIYINTLRIEKASFSDWNQFITSLIKAYKKSITIEKTL